MESIEEPISNPLPNRGVRQVKKKKRTSKEFKLFAQIRENEMSQVILELGSNVNTLPKSSWEQMGIPKMVWSPIQLLLVNEFKIYPIGRLKNALVDLDGI